MFHNDSGARHGTTQPLILIHALDADSIAVLLNVVWGKARDDVYTSASPITTLQKGYIIFWAMRCRTPQVVMNGI